MGIFKTRTNFINLKLSEVKDEITKRLLANGFIPKDLQFEYDQYIATSFDNSEDADIDKISNSNWFAINPKKVAGEITPGTGFLNPIIVKGTLNDAIEAVNNILNTSNQNTEIKYDQPNELNEIVDKINTAFEKQTIDQYLENLPNSVKKLFSYLIKKPNSATAGMDIKFDNKDVKDFFHYAYRAINGPQFGDNNLDFKTMFINKFGQKSLDEIERMIDQKRMVLKNGAFLSIDTNKYNGKIDRIVFMFPQIFSGIKENAVFYLKALSKPEIERDSGDEMIISAVNKILNNQTTQTPKKMENPQYDLLKHVFTSLKKNDKGMYIPSATNAPDYFVKKAKTAGFKIKVVDTVNDGSDAYDIYIELVEAASKTKAQKDKDAAAAYSETTKDNSKGFEVIFTNAGGSTVASNKLDFDKVTQDYRTLAHIAESGDIKYFQKDLPKNVVKEIESMANSQMAAKLAARKTGYMMFGKHQPLNTKYKAGDKVQLIDTSEDPTMARYNSATVVKYEGFDHSQKKDWIVLLKADQDLGEFTAWESNMQLKDTVTTKDFLEHGKKEGRIIFGRMPKNETPKEYLTDKNEIINALADLATKSKSTNEFLTNVQSGIAWNFKLDIMSPEFISAIGLIKGNPDENKKILKHFYLSQGNTLKAKRSLESQQARTEINVQNIIDLANSANQGPEIEIPRNDLQVIIKNNLLEDPIDIKKTQTVSETIKKYNQSISENEIKAWVYYKRRFGNPMKGWDSYFLTGGAGFSTLIQTTKDTVVKDNKFTDLRTVPANTNLGIKTKFKHEYKETNYIICKTPQGELVWVNVNDVKEVKHTTNETIDAIRELVEAKALLFDGNEYYPYPVYLFGDIYAKITSLNDNKSAIVEAFGEAVFNDQLAKVREYLPKLKSFRDPIKNNRPNMLSLSEFANNTEIFGVTELNEETGVKLGRIVRGRFNAQTEKITLFDAFEQWIEEAVRDTDLKNTTRADIKKYYFAKSISWPKDSIGKDVLSNTQKEELIGNARLAAEELFSEFLAIGLTFDDATALDVIWNEKYNAFTSVIQFVDKVPIAFNGSTMFKDGLLEIKPAQRQGLAYLQLVGAGTLAYDVGFGKTLTGILNLAQELSQGAIKRPLIVVPKPTYKNWLKELFGYWASADGQRVDFNEFAGAIYHYGAFSGVAGVKLNDWYNLSGKHFEKLLKQYDGDINKLIPENTITLVSYRGFEQMGFSRSVSQDLFDSIARVIMQKDAMEGQERKQKSEKQEAKEKVSFYQKIQGWLGLGNKNAVVNVDVCGFDHITVDEAHNFKNVFASCGKDPSTGRKLFDISASQSTRAVKMFFITNYIQAKFGKKVVDLTATPFTNSPLEIYSMLSFVGLDTLNQYNLYNIKKFFEMFVLQTIEYAIDSKGEIITKPVIKSFQNLKLLQTILFNHFHYKADPKEAGVVRPCKIDLPNKDITTYLEMNEWQRNNQVDVKIMAKSVSRQNPGAGLKAMSMSLDNAFSPYLFAKETPDSASDFVEQSPKIKYAIECIRTVKDWHEARGEECSGIVLYSNRGLSYFQYIQDYLINDIGFKSKIEYDEEIISEVEIISGGGGEAEEDRKELIKDAFNAGVVKIIIGTGTIREGINLQKRGTVLIDLYPEWNPTDIMQLKGRIWRQGNMFGYIRFVMPLVINSMDNFINQKLDEKGQRIASIWAPIGDLNTLENTSDLDPAEIKYQLVDDVTERFKMKYETIKNDMERMHKILTENRIVIDGVAQSVESLKNAESEIFDVLNEKKETWQTLLAYLKSLPLANYKKVKEMSKTVSDIERVTKNISELIENFTKYEANRYDINQLLIVTRIIKQRNFDIFTDYSNTGSEIKAKLSDISSWSLFRIYDRDYDRLIEAWSDVRRAEKSVLNAYGKSWQDDITPILKDVDKKINALDREKEAIESEEYQQKLKDGINTEMEIAKSVRGNLDEQVQRFASLNHILSYLNDNTDKENCEIPTVECCPTNGINVIYHDKQIIEPVQTIEQIDEMVKLSPEALYFIPKNQLSIIRSNMEFNDVRERLNAVISQMPKTYETDQITLNNKTAWLHYFYGNMDWYIFEKDMGDGGKDKTQKQAYGMASFGDGIENAELGYISIADIVSGKTPVELDLYFTPTTWGNLINEPVIGATTPPTKDLSQIAEITEAIDTITEVLPDLKGKDKKDAKYALEVCKELLADLKSDQLKQGIDVEQEHKAMLEKVAAGKIDVKEAVKQTAKEHLSEDPDYYTKLKEVEGGSFKDLVGRSLWITSGSPDVWEIISVNEIAPDNIKIEAKTGGLTKTESYTAKELNKLKAGKKIRSGTIELLKSK